MPTPREQPELPLPQPPPSDTIAINGRCTLRRDGKLRLVCVAGLAMHHWTVGDQTAEAYAMVSLVQCGYADQNEVARAFEYSTRTLRRRQRRWEEGGLSSLGMAAGRPEGTQGQPSPWARTAVTLRQGGMSVRAIAQRFSVSIGAVSKWLHRLVPSDAPTEARALSDTRANIKTWDGSLDPDPKRRLLDRALARAGLLEDAEPIFTSGRRIPHAGVLLAIPALTQSGIFSTAQEVYGHIGPAFYGLRTTMLTMLLMALLRVKRPEALKEHAPPELGRLLGLDRVPEVKTLRRKLTRLAAVGKGEAFGRKLAQQRVARRGKAFGFLYVDGHVRVYHGRRRIPKAHVTRMRLSMPGTTDYWVNDRDGDPVFVVTADVNAGMVAMLPKLLEEVRGLIGKRRRATVVFDRGGWSPKLFVKLIAAGFDILTYRKGSWKHITRGQFIRCAKKIDGREVAYDLNDRNIRLMKGRLRLRQITRLCANGHQTPIVTSRFDLQAVVLAYRMFERWRQENFFKYLREEYALDALVDYRTEAEEKDRSVPNPQRRRLDKELAVARMELKQVQALYGEAVTANKERNRPTIRGFKIAHGKLGRRIRAAQKRISALKEKRELTSARVAVHELDGEPLVRLSRERKHLTDCVKMVAYQAEGELMALLRPYYERVDDEGRTLVTTALQSAADLEVRDGELRVTLAPLSSPHRSRAITALCEELNRMKIRYPGTKLRLRYAVAP